MRSLIAATVFATMSGSAMAHQCDINIDGNMKLEDSILTVTTKKKDEIQIDQYYRLYVNDEEIALDHEQQQWVEDYYQGIHGAVPQVAEITTEAIDLATEAITVVFGELLGSDASEVNDLTDKLAEINQEIQYNFYAEDGSIRLNSENFENGEFFGEEWEQEFEEAVEEMVFNSMGRLMIAVGTEMLMSGGDMDAFEHRMETFASDLETKMEARGEQLEEKADALCLQLAKVDHAENQLQSSIGELSGLNVFDYEENHESM